MEPSTDKVMQSKSKMGGLMRHEHVYLWYCMYDYDADESFFSVLIYLRSTKRSRRVPNRHENAEL